MVGHNPNTRVGDATAVTFSVKYFNLLKLYLLSGSIFRKWFTLTFYLFIHEHLIIMLSLTVNLISVTTLLLLKLRATPASQVYIAFYINDVGLYLVQLARY